MAAIRNQTYSFSNDRFGLKSWHKKIIITQIYKDLHDY